MLFNPTEHPHKRYNILTGQWVLFLPEPAENRKQHDENIESTPGICAFPPGKPQLLPDTPDGELNKAGLLRAVSEKGVCKLICFSPDKQTGLAALSEKQVFAAVELLCNEYKKLSSHSTVQYIRIVQSRGDGMAQHMQLWAHSSIPDDIVSETGQQKKFYDNGNKSLLSAYLNAELEENERIIMANQDFVVLKPYWAGHPLEALIISRRQVLGIHEFSPAERLSFARILLEAAIWYDGFFENPIQYTATMYQSPVNDGLHPEWHWHMHFLPSNQ